MDATTKLQVAVLMGGPSAEHDVSLRSGRKVAAGLRQAGHRVTEIDVPGPAFDLPADTDVVFLALHGTFGEDGQIQRLLDDRGIPYTGSGPEASERAFDKVLAKEAFRAAGVPTPADQLVNGQAAVPAGWSLPLVVKPVRQGSSVGVSIVRQTADLPAACAEAYRHDSRVLLEEYILGRELTVGVLGDRTLPVVEIIPRQGWFDYSAKYTPGNAEEIVPACLDAVTTARVQALAWRAHSCLGCRDVSRVDLILRPDGAALVLEVNTLPGMTDTSLLPQAAQAVEIEFPALCDRLVSLAVLRQCPEVTAR